MSSFLFYDLETFGLDSSHDRISQFAAIRTDADLNEIGEPVDFLIQAPMDALPSPWACAVTQTSPWANQQSGLRESQAMRRIHELMAEPGTCTLGHNSYKFDDAFIRNGFYRNFLPLYEREWRNGNSRYDSLNLLRAAYALRPDGIHWPRNADGNVQFTLESLAELNNLRIGAAHEALSDVRATIGMVRLVQQLQPKFFQYLLGFRAKQTVQACLRSASVSPYLCVSSRFGLENHSIAPVLALFPDPAQASRHVVFNLRHDPADTAAWIAAAQNDPAATGKVPGLSKIAVNEAPPLFALEHVTDAELQRLGLERSEILARAGQLRKLMAESNLQSAWQQASTEYPADPDVDAQMYSGFFENSDESWRRHVLGTAPQDLATLTPPPRSDRRLSELFWRYRARNFPDSLSPAEREQWRTHCAQRLADPDNPRGKAVFADEIAKARAAHADHIETLRVLDETQAFADDVLSRASVV